MSHDPTPDAAASRAADERRLLGALAEGDRSAAERLVDLTYGQIFAALTKLTGGDRDLAADLTQETYRKAWRSLGSFDRRSRFGTWLYRIAYNTFLNHIRRPQPLQALDDGSASRLEDPARGQDDRLDRREVAARLRRAVIGLPDELRFTVTARFWGELAVEDIARLENVTGAAIRKRLKNAMARMRL
ncbi:MAG: sigma-70 family RNA polymerase sigma factor, partial [Acidobacteriota bacterium]